MEDNNNKIIVIGDIGVGKTASVLAQLKNTNPKVEIVNNIEGVDQGSLMNFFGFKNKEVQHHLEIMSEHFIDINLTKKEKEAIITPIRTIDKIGRNEICRCGSGKKYKKCCI